MVRRTKEDALATRERLLDTAEQVFLARGVTRSSLQDIAAAAGVTRGALYWHFKDKADLFEAMMARVSMPCEQAVLEIDQRGGEDEFGDLREFALVPLRRMAADERTRRVFAIAMHHTEYTADMEPVREKHLAAMEDYRQRMEQHLARARRAGRLSAAVSPRAASLALHAMVDGLLMHATLARDLPDVLRTATAAIDTFLDGLRAMSADAGRVPAAGAAKPSR
jgi:TetR/AcrR family acrAB operon transcriptional repressor